MVDTRTKRSIDQLENSADGGSDNIFPDKLISYSKAQPVNICIRMRRQIEFKTSDDGSNLNLYFIPYHIVQWYLGYLKRGKAGSSDVGIVNNKSALLNGKHDGRFLLGYKFNASSFKIKEIIPMQVQRWIIQLTTYNHILRSMKILLV